MKDSFNDESTLCSEIKEPCQSFYAPTNKIWIAHRYDFVL